MGAIERVAGLPHVWQRHGSNWRRSRLSVRAQWQPDGNRSWGCPERDQRLAVRNGCTDATSDWHGAVWGREAGLIQSQAEVHRTSAFFALSDMAGRTRPSNGAGRPD